MEFQPIMRTFIECFLIGGAIFAYPLGAALLTDMVARRLLWGLSPTALAVLHSSGKHGAPAKRATFGRVLRISVAAGVSIVGNVLGALLVYAAAAVMLILISDRFWWTFLLITAVFHSIAMAALSVVSSVMNLGGPDRRRHFPEAERMPEIAAECDPGWIRQRSYESGRHWFLRMSASTTGVVLAVSFVFFPFGLGVYSNSEVWAVAFGEAMGSLTAAWLVIRASHRLYARSRALSAVLQEIVNLDEATDSLRSGTGLQQRLDRRSELHILLRRAVYNIRLKRRRNGFKGRQAESVVLLGAARHFETLGDPDEHLAVSPPPSTVSTMRRLAVVLAGAKHEASLRRLAINVGALGPDGRLDPELSALIEGGVRARIERAQPLVGTIASIVGIAIAVLAVVLNLLGFSLTG